MNNHGQSSSPGFLYFQTNTPQEETQLQQETPNVPDFIAFSNQSNNGHYTQQEFFPSHFSSPQRGGRSGNFRHQDRRQKQSPLWRGSPRRGGFRSFNSSHNSSYNNSSNSQNSLQEHSDLDGSRFLHSSFTEDPWKKLETKLAQSMSSQSSLDQNLTS